MKQKSDPKFDLEFDLKASGKRQMGDELNKVINEMTIEDKDSSPPAGDDLLDLMDQLQ